MGETENRIGRDKEWVREKEGEKKVERGKATERVRESESKTGKEEKETKPREPLRPQRLNKRRSGRQQPALPSPSILCAALKAFII